ncbi:MAG TPA: helix-turn-helix domain-containing protein, partial [Micropepsaceae bacterium]|nr:helix-turn-helix domain-containing protein [Micropepsaceae bacterium]
MSFQAMTWAIERPVASPATRCVIMSIANRTGHDGHGWVYQDTIARESVMSVDTVQRRVPELIEAGFLRRIKLKRFGRRTHDYYILGCSQLFTAPLDDIRPFLPSSCDVMEEADHMPAP